VCFCSLSRAVQWEIMVFDRRATETSIKHATPKDTNQLSFGAGDVAYKLQVAQLRLLQLG
jgi:hypothetical protein